MSDDARKRAEEIRDESFHAAYGVGPSPKFKPSDWVVEAMLRFADERLEMAAGQAESQINAPGPDHPTRVAIATALRSAAFRIRLLKSTPPPPLCSICGEPESVHPVYETNRVPHRFTSKETREQRLERALRGLACASWDSKAEMRKYAREALQEHGSDVEPDERETK